MLRTFLLVWALSILNLAVFSQKQNDLQKWGLKGKVLQVNYYQSYNPAEETAGTLSDIDVFDRRGNVSVQYNFIYFNNECYYKQTVYSYDRRHRKKETAVRQSESNPAFCAVTPPLFKENQIEHFDVRTFLVEKTTSAYDRRGRLEREAVFDPDGRLVQESKYEYDARGRNTRFTIEQWRNRLTGSSGKFVKTIDSRMVYRDNGKTTETFRYEDGKPISKGIGYRDGRGRYLRSEQYRLQTDDRNNIIKSTLGSLGKSHYEGAFEILDWTIYDNSANPTTQVFILSENDEELVSLEYSHRNSLTNSTEPGAQALTPYRLDAAEPELDRWLKRLLKFDRVVERPEWIARELEARFYEFDARGNFAQVSTVKREPGSAGKRVSVRKKDIIYFNG